MKNIIIIFLLSSISFLSLAQTNKLTRTNTVTFTANINYIIGTGLYGAFNPERDSLLVEGLDWDGETTIIGNRMLYPDPITNGLYSTTLIISSTLDSVRWKFRAGPYYLFTNGGLETGIERWLIIGENGNVISLDTIIPRINTFVQQISGSHLLLTLNISNAKNRYNGSTIPLNEIEFIGIKGNQNFWAVYQKDVGV